MRMCIMHVHLHVYGYGYGYGHGHGHVYFNFYIPLQVNTHIYIYTIRQLRYPREALQLSPDIPGAIWTRQRLSGTWST